MCVYIYIYICGDFSATNKTGAYNRQPERRGSLQAPRKIPASTRVRSASTRALTAASRSPPRGGDAREAATRSQKTVSGGI